MILGTPRIWWIAAAVPLVVAIGIFTTGSGGFLGGVAGIALLLLAMGLFAAAPMRYGREKPGKAAESSVNAPEPLTPSQPPQPRPTIDARDASDV